MPSKKLLGAAALSAALVGGLAAGAVAGSPSISAAQEEDDTTTTVDESTSTDESTDSTNSTDSTDDSEETDDEGRPRPGRFGPFGHFGAFDLDVAAEALGISDDELEDALQDGQSIADVATERGVDVQTVIDALVTEATAEIDEAVADGDLGANQADTLKEELPERVTDLVNGEGRIGRGPGPGRIGGRFIDLDVAAEALGITDDELEDALQDGQSIADVATERGVDVQTVIDALVTEATAEIDEAAADAKEELPERVTDLVNGELEIPGRSLRGL
jgi:uncharacterized protein YidB (DUF937 family)